MSRHIDDLLIIDNKTLTEDLYILELKGNEHTDKFRPGQFVQVRVDGNPETFLRRPISVYDVHPERHTFRLLIQKAGSGTTKLAALKPGDFLNLVYPLGNSFTEPSAGEKVLLAGGGVGIAPLLLMGKHLLASGYKPEFLLGFRSANRIPGLDDFEAVGKVYVTTEDGSVGEKGFITNHSVLFKQHFDVIYCCGPDPMMKAVAAHSRQNGIRCEVSLENLMACGFGICLCCIAETVRGNLCTCTEGPVFNINDLKW
jgi:dihydroorotate dehydrogenase electron transfer subunit